MYFSSWFQSIMARKGGRSSMAVGTRGSGVYTSHDQPPRDPFPSCRHVRFGLGADKAMPTCSSFSHVCCEGNAAY